MSHTCVSHVRHMYESCHTQPTASAVLNAHSLCSLPCTYISHLCTRRTIKINKSRHTYEWVMSHRDDRHCGACACPTCSLPCTHTPHLFISHIIHTNESRHTYEQVMSHRDDRHCGACACPTWALCCTYIPHLLIRHIIHTKESRHTYEQVMWHKVNRHCGACDAQLHADHLCVPWLNAHSLCSLPCTYVSHLCTRSITHHTHRLVLQSMGWLRLVGSLKL